MKKFMLFAVLGAIAPMAFAGTEKFSDADTNDDGKLSTAEAKMALPEVLIVDNNNDGMLNLSEAEVAIPGLSLTASKGASKETATIGESEYESIVSAIAEMNSGKEGESDS